jgi:hypothetical protein
MNSDKQALMTMCKEGLLAAVVVITDQGWANAVKEACPWMTVVSRQVWTDTDPSPIMTGDETHDRQAARDWYYGPLHPHTQQCRKDVYVQLTNETSYHWDGYFQDELMKLAEGEGYHLALPADSGGAPGDYPGMTALWFDAQGKAHSDFWVKGRSIAQRRAAKNGHLWLFHSYGNIQTGRWEWSYDVGAYPWHAGRQFYFLDLIPDAIPNLLIGEFAAAGSQFTEQMGWEACWDNYTGFVKLALEKHPHMMAKMKGICQWTFGSPGFRGQDVQQWIWQFSDVQRK